ncbi:hypothetical protein LPJ59_005128, partial [Coemansia sp. RSA 2399]
MQRQRERRRTLLEVQGESSVGSEPSTAILDPNVADPAALSDASSDTPLTSDHLDPPKKPSRQSTFNARRGRGSSTRKRRGRPRAPRDGSYPGKQERHLPNVDREMRADTTPKTRRTIPQDIYPPLA